MGDLIVLGQEILKGGFPFAECTRLVKMKVEELTFMVPVSFLEDGLGEEEMSLNFVSPPIVIGVNEDWTSEVAEETDSQAPMKGDRLLSIGNKSAQYMTKEEFDMELPALV